METSSDDFRKIRRCSRDDVAPARRWKRFVPAWLRSLIWADSAAGYDAFLSYSWASDKDVAPVVQTVIHRFLCPWYKVRAKTVFRDLSCLPAGSDLHDELFARLDRSTHLIVLACPEAATSRGMEMEAEHWFSRERDGEVLIIVTDWPPEQPCTWAEIRDHLLPPALRTHFAATEPLWVSLARHRRDILRDPKSERLRGEVIEELKQVFLRLYPGTTWEELHGEERAQKRRAMGLMGGLAALFFALALTIVWEWSNTVRAYDEAASNYRAAVKVATSTSKIVKEQLMPDGVEQPKSVLAKTLLKAPLDTFTTVSAKYETPGAALSRVQLFELLWNSYFTLGEYANASSVAENEFAVAQRHERASQFEKGDPSHADWLRYMVRGQENLGDDARYTGDLTRGEAYFREALSLAKRLSTEPGGAWKNELPHAYERLGDVLRDEGRFSEALVDFRIFLDFAAAGTGIAWQRNVAVVHGKIGDVLAEQGHLDGAENEYRTNLAMSKKLAKANTPDLQRGVAVAYERLGFVRRKLGRLFEAGDAYQQELAVLQRLLKKDSANVQWRRDEALAFEGLGDVSRDEKNLLAAQEYYKKYLGIVSGLLGKSGSNARVRHDVAVGYQRLGDAALGLGRRREAQSNFRRCISASAGASALFEARNSEPRDVGEYCRSQVRRLVGRR